MKVVYDRHGIDPVNALHVFEAFFVEPQGLIVFHVPDVLARDGESALREGKGILQVSAAAENLRPL